MFFKVALNVKLCKPSILTPDMLKLSRASQHNSAFLCQLSLNYSVKFLRYVDFTNYLSCLAVYYLHRRCPNPICDTFRVLYIVSLSLNIHTYIHTHTYTYTVPCEVFIPLHLFHVLLCCSLMLHCFKLLFFPTSIYTTYTIMTKQKQNGHNFVNLLKIKN